MLLHYTCVGKGQCHTNILVGTVRVPLPGVAGDLCSPPDLLHCSLLEPLWLPSDFPTLSRCPLACIASDVKCAPGAVLAGRGAKRMKPEEQEYEDDFVVDDEEEPDWRQALKSITKYDPSK